MNRIVNSDIIIGVDRGQVLTGNRYQSGECRRRTTTPNSRASVCRPCRVLPVRRRRGGRGILLPADYVDRRRRRIRLRTSFHRRGRRIRRDDSSVLRNTTHVQCNTLDGVIRCSLYHHNGAVKFTSRGPSADHTAEEAQTKNNMWNLSCKLINCDIIT